MDVTSALVVIAVISMLVACIHFASRLFATILCVTLVVESLITHNIDIVIGGSRIYCQDLLAVSLLVAVPIECARRWPKISIPFWIVAGMVVALLIPVLVGVQNGANSRDVLRDMRPVVHFVAIIPLGLLIDTEEKWKHVVRSIVRSTVIACCIMLIGFVFDWRLLDVSAGWMTAASASGEVSRGYGLVSAYLFIPISLALLLEAPRTLSGHSWMTFSVVLLLMASLALSFVRANWVFAIIAIAILLSNRLARRARKIRMPTTVVCGLAAGIGLLSASAFYSETGIVAVQRALSVLDDDFGGWQGQGTAGIRHKSVEVVRLELELHDKEWFGFGYGMHDSKDEVLVRYLNHNSYAWLLHKGGWVVAALVVVMTALLGISLIVRASALDSYFATGAAIVGGLCAVAYTSGVLFNSLQPSGMLIVALFGVGSRFKIDVTTVSRAKGFKPEVEGMRNACEARQSA